MSAKPGMFVPTTRQRKAARLLAATRSESAYGHGRTIHRMACATCKAETLHVGLICRDCGAEFQFSRSVPKGKGKREMFQVVRKS